MTRLGSAIRPPYGGNQPITQPVQGAPTPVTTQPAGQAAGTLGPGGPTPNPYNLPQDLAPNYGDGVYQDIENAQQRAVQGNQQRLGEAKAGYQQLEQDYATREQGLLQNLQGLGQSQRDDLSRKFEQESAGLSQDMINRGIYGTTTALQQQRGLSHDQQQQQLRLEDMLTREKMDYGRALSGETLGARGQQGYLGLLERVNETGPDPNMAAQLGQMIGTGQAGTPDYLSAIGQPTGQAPTGPAPPGGTLGTPEAGNYNIGKIPVGNVTTSGIPSQALPPPDFVGGEGLGSTSGGTGGGSSSGGRRPAGGGGGGSGSRGGGGGGGRGGGGGFGGGSSPTSTGPGGTTDPGGYRNPVPDEGGTGSMPKFSDQSQSDFDTVMDISGSLGIDEGTSSLFYSWISRFLNFGERSLKDVASDGVIRAMAPTSYAPILEQLSKGT